jgi:ribosomal protein S18 acetylase RimI-like enzyme
MPHTMPEIDTGWVNLAVREATVEDASAIAEVHVRSWNWAYAGLIPDDQLSELTVELRKARWRSLLERPRQPFGAFAATADDRVAGFATCGGSRDQDTGPEVGELYAVYLAPEYAGLGLGRRLMDASSAFMTEAGFRRAVLWVLAGNDRARGFYSALGWEPDGATSTECEGLIRNVPIVRYARDL